jgi:nucleoside phosphorylase
MKILIITALLKEQKALIDKISHLQEIEILQHFFIGKIESFGKYNNVSIDVGIINLDGVGNIEAGVKTTHAILYFNPDFVILSGICGGFKINSSLNLGDIVIPDKIIYYEYGKIENNKTIRRYINFDIDPSLIQHVKDFILTDWSKAPEILENNAPNPKIYINPLASGEKVVAEEAFQVELIQYCQKLIGVEMEGYGTGIAVLKSGMPIKFLIIKSISDWADSSKNDAGHDAAIRNSAEFLIYFIKNFNLNLVLNKAN